MLEYMKKRLMSLYLQYELVTCIYMFEPWEKKLINSLIGLILALVLFSSYVYLPSYMRTFIQFMSPLAMDKESTVYAPSILKTEAINMR